jgi:tRNA-Thr(GGU) m(6)t(6)A37 methyltransferase TsaA
MTINVQPIAIIHTPFKEKFAIPRQPGLVKSAKGQLRFLGEFNDPNYVRGIEQFSHLWLLFHFHQTAHKGHSALVRPPRLGGNKKQGVFATRSTFRPNSIGMSVVELDSVDYQDGQLTLIVKGIDLLDGTPIVDIKPYVPYADNIPQALGGMAQHSPELMPVEFLPHVYSQLVEAKKLHPELQQLITEVLSQDPRPAYHGKTQSDKTYGMSLYNFNIQWQVIEHKNHVIDINLNAQSSAPIN